MANESITVCVYTHRHGNDVWSFASPEAAYKIVAERYVGPQLDDELPGIDCMHVRAAISGMIERGEYEAAVDAYNEATLDRSDVERFEFFDTAVQTAPRELACKCPKCGNADPDEIEIVETFSAYHPIRSVEYLDAHAGLKRELLDGATLNVENALGTTCPSEHFDEGAGDYKAHCRACQHTDETNAFGLPPAEEWEWV